MKKHFVVGVLGLAAAMMVTFPVSAHHRFGAYGDGSHDCYITPDHFCAIAQGVCDGAGYGMDDHTRGYCNQSCVVPQTTYVPSQTQSSQVPQEAPVTTVTPQETQATPAAPQEAPVTQEVPAVPQETQMTQTVPQTQTAPQTNSWYGGGGHHRSGHHGRHGCY